MCMSVPALITYGGTTPPMQWCGVHHAHGPSYPLSGFSRVTASPRYRKELTEWCDRRREERRARADAAEEKP